jgi:hypothetical protein
MGGCETIVKKLFIDEGLLLTDMEVTYKGISLWLKRVLVDTAVIPVEGRVFEVENFHYQKGENS